MNGYISEMDWARLAMAIDCEGTINISKQTRKYVYYFLHIAIYTTTPSLTDWIVRVFGAKTITKRRTSSISTKLGYEARFSAKDKDVVLHHILPYLIIKRKQAELAIKFRKTFDRWIVLPDGLIDEREQMYDKMHWLNTG